ncbi:hypothetical protein [Blastococcus sp. Marseille-P5729]|uniref:hypothetical protein n=1 Tax=Blastococcus sp. Marseille-P5729 TaxID=2086582 RepID=UPI000D1022C5|nr:hypothetical protein [Blastococcus sp. Marseille-P5729]
MSVGSRRLRELVALICVVVLALTACDGEDDDAPDPDALTATTAAPSQSALVLDGATPADLAHGVSSALFESAPVVVLASESEQLRAASAAVALGVPVLVDGPQTADELTRLETEVALVIGTVSDPGIDVVVPTADDELAQLIGAESAPIPVTEAEAAARVAALDPASPALLIPEAGTDPGESLDSDRDELPQTHPPERDEAVVVLSTGAAVDAAALGSAKAAGAQTLVNAAPDPRATSETVQALAAAKPSTVIGLGPAYGDPDRLAAKATSAATGVELPGGGQLALPGKTYVALYGSPITGALGVLGEQSAEETIARAQEHASWYEPLTDEAVVPTLEIIATVASEGPGSDGDYSAESDVAELEPLVDLAEQNGQYVILDLQPGRTDFLTQAKLYEELLKRPHVGLALDPEWRLGPDEKHLTKVGSVPVEEVNQVATWLADLTKANNLPQKVLVLHMFKVGMIPAVDTVDQSRDEIAVLIHADGQGGQGMKQATWSVLHQNAPSINYWGWKNFYDEDKPMLTPEQTMSQVDPIPDFISYQ